MGTRSHARARRRLAVLFAAATVLAALPAAAHADGRTRFKQVNLVSNVPGQASATDPNLVNAWGLAFGPNTPAWVADNGKDVATLYSGGANHTPTTIIPLVVGIPGGAPTGQVYNPTSGFDVKSGMSSGPATFIFSSEAGDITGWNINVPPPPPSMQAQLGAHTPDAIYKGLAIASSGGQTYLYATDFHNNRIDVFNSSFSPTTLSGDFTDRHLPPGYAPFGIQAFGDHLLVTYAKQDADAEDDVAGPGNGFVDVFNSNGEFVRRLVSHGFLNSPWGLVMAPSGFGRFTGDLLVGNFGNGKIHAYDPMTGHFRGTLRGDHGLPIKIDGLWALQVGNGVTGDPGAVLFTAGPNDEKDGLFGELVPAGN